MAARPQIGQHFYSDLVFTNRHKNYHLSQTLAEKVNSAELPLDFFIRQLNTRTSAQ